MTTLVRVTAPEFCAGLIVERGVCVRAAPILRVRGWVIGMTADQLRALFAGRGWTAAIVRERS